MKYFHCTWFSSVLLNKEICKMYFSMWLDRIPGFEETDYVLMFFFLLSYEYRVQDKKNISLGNTMICS